MIYSQWLNNACAELITSDSPKRDAEILLGFVTQKARTFLLAFGETELTVEQQQQLLMLLERRKLGEPIAYLVGEREFWSLPLTVSSATLIPRPDTERLVELALELLPVGTATILDLGSGSGAIALALASERPDCYVIGVDFQAKAVKLAQGNAHKLAINNVVFMQSNWYQALSGQRFQIIVSNPPYLDRQDQHLQQGDVRFEPESALIAERQGLADIEHIVSQAENYLANDGWLLIEHGWQQGAAVRTLFLKNGYQQVATFTDYGGNERVTLGQVGRYCDGRV